jgi:integrase
MAVKVERTKAGSYRVRFRHGPSRSDPSKKRMTSETFDGNAAGKKKAQQFATWLDAVGPQGALDLLYAEYQQADVPTLDALAVDHIEHLTGIERGTRLTYQRLWSRTWSKHIGHLPANRVGQDDIRKAVNQLAASYSSKSLENQRGLLSGVLTRAVEKGYLGKNPVRGIKLPRGSEGDAVEMRLLTSVEYADVEQRMVAQYQPLLRFLAGTGCRWGEAVALTVADIDLPNVRIRRALKWSPDNIRTVGATKTRRSNRTVAVPGELHAELERLCEGKKGADLVFTASRGGQVQHRTFWSRYWLPAVKHLSPRPRIHDLRHSHASWLLAAGVPIHIVQARLGHESIQTTVDTYGHLLPDAQLAAATAAQAVFTVRAPAMIVATVQDED